MIYLNIIALGWFITEFEPFQLLIEYAQEKLPNNKLLQYLLGSFSCWQCMTFWSGWILSGDFLTACVASLGSLILYGWMQQR